jgi:hypothetical protein
VERAAKSFDKIWANVEAELAEAEATFRRVGPWLSRSTPLLPELVYQRHQANISACMVANKKALLDSERARVKAQTEGGISATDKQRRLADLERALLKAAAKRELLLREQETAGEFSARPVHPELAVYKRSGG